MPETIKSEPLSAIKTTTVCCCGCHGPANICTVPVGNGGKTTTRSYWTDLRNCMSLKFKGQGEVQRNSQAGAVCRFEKCKSWGQLFVHGNASLGHMTHSFFLHSGVVTGTWREAAGEPRSWVPPLGSAESPWWLHCYANLTNYIRSVNLAVHGLSFPPTFSLSCLLSSILVAITTWQTSWWKITCITHTYTQMH